MAEATEPGPVVPSLHDRDTPSGLIYGLAAYVWWGLMPLYIRRLDGIPAGEIIGWRLVTSVPVLAAIVAVFHRGPQFVAALRSPYLRRTLFLTTLLVGGNWFLYTYTVSVGNSVEASLGYFLQPLLNVVLGVLIYRERFRFGQKLAIAIAAAGMVVLFVVAGRPPWIAVTLACSFGLYTAIRKMTPVDGLVGLSVEIIFMLPFSAGYLLWLWKNGEMHAGTLGFTTDLWLSASGFITAIPLVCFGQAARRLRLSTLGFMQYIAPTLVFILAVTVFGESVAPLQWAGYALVWLALAAYSVDTFLAFRGQSRRGRRKEKALTAG